MRHIHRDGEESIEFGRYLEALATYRDRLPKEVALFAGDEERFVLDHPKSLHDARLERLTISETEGSDNRPSFVKLELLLRGQQGDRHIRITYREVERYEIRGKKGELGSHDSHHGDIYTHEVRVGESGGVVHEVLFASGSVIETECADFQVQDEIDSTNG